jgi:hypothetical protein
MSDIIEKCVRNKVRFPVRGQNSVEDLYDLTTGQLDDLYSALDATKIARTGARLSAKKSNAETILDMQMEAVRYIYETKVAEAQERESAMLNAQELRRWEDRLARKQEQNDDQLSADEIEAKIRELRAK